MLRKLLASTCASAVCVLWLGAGPTVALAADDGAVLSSVRGTSLGIVHEATRWSAYGFNINAPTSMWPMLELLHNNTFDWALAAASRGQTQITWADLPAGRYGQYSLKNNTIKLSPALQSTGVEAGAAILAHELTHLNDDLNGVLGDDVHGKACYEAEVRAFSNEANLWSMLFGKPGKKSPDAIEAKENAKMRAFVGKAGYLDLVLRTTQSYIQQCGSSN